MVFRLFETSPDFPELSSTYLETGCTKKDSDRMKKFRRSSGLGNSTVLRYRSGFVNISLTALVSFLRAPPQAFSLFIFPFSLFPAEKRKEGKSEKEKGLPRRVWRDLLNRGRAPVKPRDLANRVTSQET
jgi:hypothetical protein